jgi:photosynthetic reaction center cytochrome c subunit
MLARLFVALFTVATLSAQQTPPPNPAAPPQQPWQPPDPTNLQVFPKDVSKRDLINAMRSFTRGLGVRCEFCHVGEGNDLSKFDFASDEKRQKKNTRVMMTMTRDINARLANIPEPRPADTLAVSCYTCHRGQQKPLISPQ